MRGIFTTRKTLAASRRRRSIALALLACLAACSGDIPARVSGAPSKEALIAATMMQLAASMPKQREGYPLLANYNGFQSMADVPAYAYFGLVIAKQDVNRGAPSPLAVLRSANPRVTTLLYQRTLQVDYPLIHTMYGTNDIFPGWWLLRAGAWLSTPINATQRWIPVSDVSRFRLYDDVLVEGETMHVEGISGAALVVRRGFFSRAVAHTGGARIAAHYSYRVDLRNNIIAGVGENRRPWSLNLSSMCPRDARGRTWADYLTEFMANRLRAGNWAGSFFDNTDQVVRDAQVDVNNDNKPDGGFIGGRNVWHDGEVKMLAHMRALAPGALILNNGTLDARSYSNGREFENFPLSGTLYRAGMSTYQEWTGKVTSPRFLMLNPDTQRHWHFDLRAMRFGLASALMGNGYYLYDEGWHIHGAAWNFDEYDNGAGSALLHDTSADTRFLRVRATGKFHIGDLLVVGKELMRVRDLGTWDLVVERGVDGTTAQPHPFGSVVATPWQIAAGSGFLGQPTGPAIVMKPGVRMRWSNPQPMMRGFTHGIALLNPTRVAVRLLLPHIYWRLRGDQDPSVNSGRPSRVVSMAPYTGLIMLNAPPA